VQVERGGGGGEDGDAVRAGGVQPEQRMLHQVLGQLSVSE
jgi:hypothetical protein